MADDIDFDHVEKMLEGEGDEDDAKSEKLDEDTSPDRNGKKSRRQKDDDDRNALDPDGRSKSRERRHSKKSRGEDRGKDRDRDKRDRSRSRDGKKRDKHRSLDEGDKDKDRDRKRDKKRDKDERRRDKEGRKKKRDDSDDSDDNRDKEKVRKDNAEDETRRHDVEEKKKREVEEARRDDLTVLILNLSLKAAEFDVWTFFSKHCGKVRDIQVIRDQRSGKSKGVGYVEFYTQEACLKAMSMSGQQILGQPIKVQASQAEKNRAARIAKQQQAEALEGGPMRIYVGGLVDQLSAITDAELQELFRPFGDISGVDLHKDPYTGRCKGYAFLQFKRAQDAREAMASMNNMEILPGRSIKVGYATDSSNRGNNQTASAALQQSQLQLSLVQQALDMQDGERLDDDGGGLLSGATTRIALMHKLQRDGDEPAPQIPMMGMFQPQLTFPPAMTTLVQAGPAPPPAIVSSYVRMDNLFTAEMVEDEGPQCYDDILEDVKQECSKHGTVEKGWVDREKADGRVWVKFSNEAEAQRAKETLSGRIFSGFEIKCETILESTWIAATGM